MLIRSMLPKNGSREKKAETVKKTQIPVVKHKPREFVENSQKNKKKAESPSNAPSTYKNLPAALASVDIQELQDLLEATKVQFNNHDVIMLKTISTFLNEKLRLEKAEDSLFFDKPLDYPDKILPTGLKKIIKDTIEERSHQSRQYFFHTLLQSICEEHNRSRNFIGYLIVSQQIALVDPEVCASNFASTVILRNSYQNQPTICLSLFWALSSGSLVDTCVGLKVWMEIVSSVMNVKSYSKYCFEFLENILKVSRKTPALEDLPLEDFKTIVELLITNVQKVKSKELQKIKENCVEILTEKLVRSVDLKKIESLFLLLLSFSKRYPDLFVNGIIESIELHPKECLGVWKLNFDTFGKVNSFLFNYLCE
jgi:TMEM214, C-terminal, caspase 4 activator